MAAIAKSQAVPAPRVFVFVAAAITVLALMVRLHYVFTTVVINPLGGDAFQYVRYAENLSQGYFGMAGGPDAFRSPGYPVLIRIAMLGGDAWPTWLKTVQAMLGALTVGCTMVLARRWLPAWGAIATGVLMAFWPHNIAMAGEILSETMFGFVLTLSLLLASRNRWTWSGVAFAGAALVNPVSFLLPVALAPLLPNRRAVVALLLPALLLPGIWSLRPVEGGSERLWTNLVQGAYPLYHRAYVSRQAAEEPARIIAQIDRHSAIANQDPAGGIALLVERFVEQPGTLAVWYASKPYLLWDWDIRISDADGPYVHQVFGSPLGHWIPLAKGLNSALFWLALLGCVFGIWKGSPSLRVVGVAFAYCTLVHTVLQAEPRYSIPYRPIEMLLALSAVVMALQWVSSRLRTHGRQSVPRTSAH